MMPLLPKDISVILAAHFARICNCDAASPQNEDSKDCAVKLMFNILASP
jgi:hypothetical protein